MPLKLVPPRQGKSPNYSVRGTYLGQYVDRSTGTGEKRIAGKELKRIKDQIERGKYDQPTGPTFLSAASAYMKAGGEGRFMAPLLVHFNDTALSDIDQSAIDKAAQSLYPEATAATRNRQVYTVVSAVLKYAGVQHTLKRPKGSSGVQRTDWLWPEQAFKLFKEADKIDAEFGVFLRLLCYTGLRLSEALNLRLADVKLDESFAYIADTKSGDPRPVFLPSVLAAPLKMLATRDGSRVALFRFTKGGPLYKLLRTAKVAAALPDITFHTLRHTYATWMRRYGKLDTQGLVATGAWRDPASASRYSHTVFSEEAMKAALLPTEDGE